MRPHYRASNSENGSLDERDSRSYSQKRSTLRGDAAAQLGEPICRAWFELPKREPTLELSRTIANVATSPPITAPKRNNMMTPS